MSAPEPTPPGAATASGLARFALLLAVCGLGVAIYAGAQRRADWTRVAERSLLVVSGFVTVAILALFHAFAVHDYQLAYVASHAARSMEVHYRLAALWGGQAGSLLLWLFMLCAYGTACVLVNRNQNRGLMGWVTAVLLANCIFFLVLLCFVTDPFEKLPPGHTLSDGAGLNPLLQHPVMMIHPVMLYIGMVGFVVPLGLRLAALLSGEPATEKLAHQGQPVTLVVSKRPQGAPGVLEHDAGIAGGLSFVVDQ